MRTGGRRKARRGSDPDGVDEIIAELTIQIDGNERAYKSRHRRVKPQFIHRSTLIPRTPPAASPARHPRELREIRRHRAALGSFKDFTQRCTKRTLFSPPPPQLISPRLFLNSPLFLLRGKFAVLTGLVQVIKFVGSVKFIIPLV